MLIVNKTAGETRLYAQPPVIGSRFRRAHSIIRDEATGEYQERLPTFDYYEERLQKALLDPKTEPSLPFVVELAMPWQTVNYNAEIDLSDRT